ncbi:MAG: aminotransferase class IV [Candidatus Pacebacteria bacterium]|nr:aminotransferase class IV [Candidatus Paceibacterota bacterium]MBP9840417.1 aminotransferase class IV [Candidatus Paceibacterota bacterium]
MNEPVAFLNGAFLPLQEAKVGILDLGVLRSYGVYEGITVIGGKPFRFEDHWQRLLKSAAALSLTIPIERDAFEAALIEIAKRNSPDTRATVRVVLTGGEALGGLEHVPGRETFFINCEPAFVLAPEVFTDGVSLITSEHQRMMPEYKTINYINAVMLQPKRRAANALEILYHANGNMLECSTSNAFIVKDKVVITAKEGVLHGITRKVILELAAEAGYKTEERAVSMDDVWNADEVFITSSFKDVVPVIRIDDRKVGSGKPGTLTTDLIGRFRKYAGI